MLDNFKNSALKSLSSGHVLRSRESVGPSSLVYLHDISVKFGNFYALRNVELAVSKGEILFLTGVSGAGKTTLLRVLSGEIVPDGGRVKFSSSSKRPFISRVFQDLRLIDHKTCYENLHSAYDPNIYKNKFEFETDLRELSRILGIEHKLDVQVMYANGGLKQKIAVIRALLSRPDIFIADEPTSSLDFENAKKVFEVLNLYNVKRGLTVVWASHNRELVSKFSGRIVHIDSGKMIYSGHACFI